MKHLILFLIHLYKGSEPIRDTIAINLHIPRSDCKFTPTCSEYTAEAVQKYGAIKGSWMGFKRIFRCNPTSAGGYDPVKYD